MPYLKNLATVARRTGFPVVEVGGWKTRGHGPMASVQTIVPHHTATSRHARGDYPSLRIVRDGYAGLPGPLSHYGLGRDGTIYVIAAGRCWHAGTTFYNRQSNSNSIGIEAENDGVGEPWSDKQMESYRSLCAELAEEFKLPTKYVEGHKEIASPRGRKSDPNFDMNEFRRGVNAERTGVVAASVSTGGKGSPMPAGKGPWPTAYLTVTGKKNKYQDKALKKLLGDVGHTGTLAMRLQRHLRDKGYYHGYITWRSNIGPQTVRAWQGFLKDRGYYNGAITNMSQWGPQTTRATVKFLNDQAKLYK